MKQTPAQLKAAAKYKKANTTTYLIRVNNKTEAALKKKLDESDNKNGYIKNLIWQDIKNSMN